MPTKCFTIGQYDFIVNQGSKWCSFTAYKNRTLVEQTKLFTRAELTQDRFETFIRSIDPLLLAWYIAPGKKPVRWGIRVKL